MTEPKKTAAKKRSAPSVALHQKEMGGKVQKDPGRRSPSAIPDKGKGIPKKKRP